METNPKDHGCRERNFDTNHWESFLVKALSIPMEASGSISIFGEDPNEHIMLSKHFTAHYPTELTIRRNSGVIVTQTQWLPRPGVKRWDLLDAAKGCAVAASRHGARLTYVDTAQPKPAAKQKGRTRRKVVIPDHLKVG